VGATQGSLGHTIFLAFSGLDREAVRGLNDRLRGAGFSPWMDEKSIAPGLDWDDLISRVIPTADVVLLCLSRQSAGLPGYLRQEVERALETRRKAPDDSAYLVVVRLDECEVPEPLRALMWVDLFQPDGFAKLTKALVLELSRRGRWPQDRAEAPAAVLDFTTVTDPVSLLQSLVIFRHTHRGVIIGEHNLHGIETLPEPVGDSPAPVSFLDPGYLRHLESYHGYPANDLRLRNRNLPLAVRLLRFAIDEGLAQVVRVKRSERFRDNESGEALRFEEVRSRVRQNLGYTVGSGEAHWRGGFILHPQYNTIPQLRSIIGPDVALCVEGGNHLVVDASVESLESEVAAWDLGRSYLALYEESVRHFEARRFEDYQRFIELAAAYPRIIEGLMQGVLAHVTSHGFQAFTPTLRGSPGGGEDLARVHHAVLTTDGAPSR
jgi:hypothetical protein